MKRVTRKTFFEPLPPNTVLVARPSRYGNPFKIGEDGTRNEVIAKYWLWLERKIRENPQFLESLRGKDLACYCKPDELCHADVILTFFG